MTGKLYLFILFLFLTISANAQYRELIYYKIPLGQIEYFHKDETVTFKLKSDERYVVRKGAINMVTDSIYEMNNIRFRPDNLQWISTPPTKQLRVLKTLAGTLILSGGLATIAYGILNFPEDHLKKENEKKYHQENQDAITYSLAGLAIVAVSIPVYQMHPKRYSVSKRWKAKYQH